MPASWISPIIEFALLLGFSLSGAAGLYLMGVRRLWQLLGFAIGLVALLRSLSYLILDAIGLGNLGIEVWIGAMLAMFSLAVAVGKLEFLKLAGLVSLGSSAMILVAIGAKYLLDIGERPHTDSSRLVAIAQLILRDGESLSQLDGFFKRGFAYPALLGIAPPGRILLALTPLIFISLLVLVVGWYLEAAPKLRRWQQVSLLVGGVSVLTIPMVQISVFYLNSHTLLAIGLAAVAYGVWRHSQLGLDFKRLEPVGYALIILGVALATLTRPEGFVLAVLVYLPLLARLGLQNDWRARGKAWLPLAVAIIGISAWIYAFDYQNPHRWPVQLWLISLIGLTLSAIWLLPAWDRVRRLSVRLAFALMLLALGVAALRNSGPFFEGLRAQAKNLLQGYGEWGLLAPFAIALLVAIGWRGLSGGQRVLIQTSWLLLVGTVASKLVDGGSIGRLGTTDSVNRMWLQLLPILIVTIALGISERFAARSSSVEPARSSAADS